MKSPSIFVGGLAQECTKVVWPHNPLGGRACFWRGYVALLLFDKQRRNQQQSGSDDRDAAETEKKKQRAPAEWFH